MVRIIQPGGFSRTNLVRIGLVPHVDEVVVIGSPESMTEDELKRIQQAATDLGSKATYTLHLMPVVGEEVTIPLMLANLNRIKSSLSDKETWISTNGSTNKFVACLFVTFPDHPTITMNRSDDSYYLSDGTTRPLTKLPENLTWQLFGLQYQQKGSEHHLYDGESKIASPSKVSMKGDKLHLEWETPQTTGKIRQKGVKEIAAEIGRLCRLNSEGVYEFILPQEGFQYLDRFPLGAHRPVRLNQEISIINKNEMFSKYPKVIFPLGTQKGNQKCLHIAVNAHDITPTAHAILAHQPNHVVLWKLSARSTDEQNELDGKTSFLVSYLAGHLLSTLDEMKLKVSKSKVSKSTFFTEHPLPQVDCKFHLIELQKLSNTNINLPDEVLACEKTIFDHNSGFPGLHDKILSTLQRNEVNAERWISEIDSLKSYRISTLDEMIKVQRMNLSSLLLRKHLPIDGKIINNRLEGMNDIGDVLEIILKTTKPGRSKKWRIHSGTFESKLGKKVTITSTKNDTYFEVRKNESPKLVFGDLSASKTGQWLEDLAGHMIDHFWQSKYSIVGLKTLPIKGNFQTGGINEIDHYAITKYGIIIGESKAIDITQFKKQLDAILGQLMGEVAVFGHRRGQIPMIIIDHLSDKYDDYSNENNILICSWWELQYPDRIIHRFRYGTRTDEDKADIHKRREIEAQLTSKGEEKKKERQKSLENDGRGRQKRKKGKNLFKGFIQKSQISFIEGNERACLISDVAVLEGKPIAFGRNKVPTLRYGMKSEKCTGFKVTIRNEIPNRMKKSSGLNDGLYMIHCNVFEVDQIPEQINDSNPNGPNIQEGK